MDYIAKKEIEEKGYENILKDFVNNIHTEYCYDWDGLNSDIILPCIEQALLEIKRLNNIIEELKEWLISDIKMFEKLKEDNDEEYYLGRITTAKKVLSYFEKVDDE